MLPQLRRLGARAIGLFPLTPTGLVVLLAAALALGPLGWLRQDRVLLVVGLGGLGLVLGAALLSVVGALWLRLTAPRLTHPLELCVGRGGLTGFQVRAPWCLPLLDIRWTVQGPDVDLELTRSGRTVTERFIPRRRGQPERLERWFHVGDAFGLAGLGFPVPGDRPMRFVPDDGSLRRIEVVRALSSGADLAHPAGRAEGDLYDLRAYAPGDPIRYVLWRVYARTRELVVRAPERALAPITRTAGYLVAGPGDEAAAATARTAVATGALGDDWSFGADHQPGIAQDLRTAESLIVRSGDGPLEAGGSGLAAFVAAPRAERLRRVVVFAPAQPGPWTQRVRAVAQHTAVELVLCADRVTIDPPGSRLAGLVLLPAPPSDAAEVVVDRSALAALCRELAGVGALKVVERRTGRVFEGAHLSRLGATA